MSLISSSFALLWVVEGGFAVVVGVEEDEAGSFGGVLPLGVGFAVSSRECEFLDGEARLEKSLLLH